MRLAHGIIQSRPLKNMLRIGAVLIGAVMTSGLLLAHGGGLDARGGHFNRKTGVYHCHRCPCGCEDRGSQTRPATPKSTRQLGLGDTRLPAAGDSSVTVWTNRGSGVYHCRGTRWFGNTTRGEYMTEKKARAAGYRPAHGYLCE